MVARWKVGYTLITWCAGLRIKIVLRANLGLTFNHIFAILVESARTEIDLDFLVIL